MHKSAIRKWTFSVPAESSVVRGQARAHRAPCASVVRHREISQVTGDAECALDRDGWQLLLAFLAQGCSTSMGSCYEQARRRLIRFFSAKGATNCEDLTDITFDRVARKLAAAQAPCDVNSPIGYVLAVARLIWLEAVRREISCRTRLENHESTRTKDADDLEHEQSLELFERCLDELSPDERDLLTDYYWGRGQARIDRRSALMRKLALNPGLLRTRIHRLRAQIRSRARTLAPMETLAI